MTSIAKLLLIIAAPLLAGCESRDSAVSRMDSAQQLLVACAKWDYEFVSKHPADVHRLCSIRTYVDENNLLVKDGLIEAGMMSPLLAVAVTRIDVDDESRSCRLAEFLISNGADVSIDEGYRLSPLGAALENKRFTLANCLIRHGANLSQIVSAGFGDDAPHAIHWAIGSPDTLRLLFKKGVSPNIRDRHGNTALHYAIMLREFESIESLVGARADLSIRNESGKTPVDYAKQRDPLVPPNEDLHAIQKMLQLLHSSSG